jgi:ankyrin repeat protein
LVKTLLAHGAVVDIQDAHGNTPLWRAVFESKNRGEVIEILLASGADKNLKNNYGISPLDLAGTIANYDAMQFLG